MNQQNISLVVAASENNVIGKEGQLPWYLSADLKRFRKLTTGHHIIMGRKTFESIGRLLPDRTTIIVTRNPDYYFDGAKIAGSLHEAIGIAASDEQPFIVGGAAIYQASLEFVQTIYLTRVHTEIEVDTFFPELDWSNWNLIESERFPLDRKNDFDFSFQTYCRV